MGSVVAQGSSADRDDAARPATWPTTALKVTPTLNFLPGFIVFREADDIGKLSDERLHELGVKRAEADLWRNLPKLFEREPTREKASSEPGTVFVDVA